MMNLKENHKIFHNLLINILSKTCEFFSLTKFMIIIICRMTYAQISKILTNI